MNSSRMLAAAAVGAIVVSAAACGGSGSGSDAATAAAAVTTQTDSTSGTGETAAASRADLTGVKEYLLEHTKLLTDFTADFAADAASYYELAEAAGFDYEAVWAESADEAGPLVEKMKADWVEGNPYYEEMEGIVAGTPPLAEYDVILDAGSSAAEDPESAVPFDLTLSDGRVLKQPGNFYNLTEGALWGTLPDELETPSTPVDLDGDGETSFGEVLPDAKLLEAATEGFAQYAKKLGAAAKAWEPADSDALTALVVMVPTMSEYFGQWKESRFVAGDAATSEAFNVVSRLSDINDILGGLRVIYTGVEPLIAAVDADQGAQTGNELDDLVGLVTDLYDEEQSGNRFEPEEADALGSEAQDRATAIAGQISQAAAELGITIEQ